jgi:hypothetical protein
MVWGEKWKSEKTVENKGINWKIRGRFKKSMRMWSRIGTGRKRSMYGCGKKKKNWEKVEKYNRKRCEYGCKMHQVST